MEKEPFWAMYANVLVPGLGFLFLRRWFYAIAYFVWVPLAVLAAIFLARIVEEILTSLLVDKFFIGGFLFLFYTLVRILIFHNILHTPFRLAIQKKRHSNGAAEMKPGENHAFNAAFFNLAFPGLGFVYLWKWQFALGSFLFPPVVILLCWTIFIVLAKHIQLPQPPPALILPALIGVLVLVLLLRALVIFF